MDPGIFRFVFLEQIPYIGHMTRTPRGYRGVSCTSKKLANTLPKVLANVERRLQDEPQKVQNLWAEIVGPEVAKMARAEGFFEGVLRVKVQSSTLLSLLARQEKPRLLAELQKRLPKGKIENILFQLG